MKYAQKAQSFYHPKEDIICKMRTKNIGGKMKKIEPTQSYKNK